MSALADVGLTKRRLADRSSPSALCRRRRSSLPRSC